MRGDKNFEISKIVSNFSHIYRRKNSKNEENSWDCYLFNGFSQFFLRILFENLSERTFGRVGSPSARHPSLRNVEKDFFLLLMYLIKSFKPRCFLAFQLFFVHHFRVWLHIENSTFCNMTNYKILKVSKLNAIHREKLNFLQYDELWNFECNSRSLNFLQYIGKNWIFCNITNYEILKEPLWSRWSYLSTVVFRIS